MGVEFYQMSFFFFASSCRYMLDFFPLRTWKALHHFYLAFQCCELFLFFLSRGFRIFFFILRVKIYDAVSWYVSALVSQKVNLRQKLVCYDFIGSVNAEIRGKR